MTYGQKSLQEIKDKHGFTQTQLGEALGTSQTNVSNFLKGKVPISDPIAKKMSEKFGYDYNRIKKEEEAASLGTMFHISKEKAGRFLEGLTTDKTEDALQQLEKIKNTNGKYHNESKIVPDEEVIKIKTYVIPIKGFAGLKKALFDDMYISENFNQSTTEVPKALYASISYRVQSSGNSMPGIIPEDAWVTGVPIPEQDWIDYNFKPNKVYVLFHPYRGILFKYVENQKNNEIKLYSKNSDKLEYPDENFLITEFRKILVAIKVETFI